MIKTNQITPTYLTLGLKLQVPDQSLYYVSSLKCWRNVNDNWKSCHRKDSNLTHGTQDTGNQQKFDEAVKTLYCTNLGSPVHYT